MRSRWLIVALPAVIGLLTRIILASDLLFNPILFMRVDLGTLAMLAGLLLTGLEVIGLIFWRRVESSGDEIVELAQKAAEDRRRFLQRLDHELKNPLTAIQAGLANLADAANPLTRQEAIESIQSQTQRLRRLVADLRKLADLEIRPLDYTAVDLSEVLADVKDLAEEQSETRDRQLRFNLPQAPWPLPAVSGDQDLLFLAIYNLVSNALKFTLPGDTIEVRAFEDGATVAIEVADTGPGIPEDELPHIWEELYRGKTAHGIQGSGLGLALVRAISDRHGGQVNLRSRIGQGSVVTLRLPVNESSGG